MKHGSFAIGEECPASWEKLRTKGSQTKTFVKHITDSHYRHLINTERLRNREDLSPHTSIRAHANHKPTDFLFPPMANFNSAFVMVTYSAFGDMPSSRTRFHGYNNRNRKLPKATYKCHLSYRHSLQIMHIILFLLDIGIRLYHVNKSRTRP